MAIGRVSTIQSCTPPATCTPQLPTVNPNPSPMATAQPDMHAISNALRTLGTEVPKFVNIVAVSQNAQVLQSLQHLLQSMNDVQTRLTNLETRFTSTDTRLADIDTRMTAMDTRLTDILNRCVFPILNYRIESDSLDSHQLLPMRLFNASASDYAPLYVPPGIAPGILPASRRLLFEFTGKHPATMGEW